MEPDFPLRPGRTDWKGRRGALGRMVPGLVICAIGGLMLGLAQGQPVWLDDHFGPGLMAELLGFGVIGLGAVWALLSARAAGRVVPAAGCSNTGCAAPGLPQSGPALLGAVLSFALSVPVIGLVLSAGLAAALAAWGAGERTPRALAVTVLGLMALVALVGVALLPSTAPLWPAV